MEPPSTNRVRTPPEFERGTLWLVGLGSLFEIAAFWLPPAGMAIPEILRVIGLVGTLLVVWGCCRYAAAKGYGWMVGMLGLLSCLGGLILFLLPDKQQ